jgi:urease accessory protein
MLCGALAAFDWPLSRELNLVLVGVVGVLLGCGAGTELQQIDWGLLLGDAAGLLAMAFLVSVAVAKAKEGAVWRRILMRVAGSWLAGIGLLMLGWQPRGGRVP